MFSFLVAEDFVASFDCLDKPWLGAVESSFAWLRIGSEYVVLKNVDIIDVAFWCENGFEILKFSFVWCIGPFFYFTWRSLVI